MSKTISIAIDGPSGAGKSTTAASLSRKLNILHLDTGAMYRAAGLACLNEGVKAGDADAIIKVVKAADIDIAFEDNQQITKLNGENVNAKIRTNEVSKWASDVSKIPEVRLKLVEIQRNLSNQISMILDGRDIGTFVLPDAEVKVYLTADEHKRAERRYKELLNRGEDVDFEEVLKVQNYRDQQDKNREFAPLKQAEDAYLIDTTDLGIDETADIIIEYMQDELKIDLEEMK